MDPELVGFALSLASLQVAGFLAPRFCAKMDASSAGLARLGIWTTIWKVEGPTQTFAINSLQRFVDEAFKTRKAFSIGFAFAFAEKNISEIKDGSTGKRQIEK